RRVARRAGEAEARMKVGAGAEAGTVAGPVARVREDVRPVVEGTLGGDDVMLLSEVSEECRMHRARELAAGARAGRHSDAWIFGTMGISAALSLLAAFVLAIDAWQVVGNPDEQLACDINAVLSCGK